MMMPGRKYTGTSGYRYGFNGKEKDNEVKGLGNQMVYENRIYDPRIGRWLSVDPLQKKYSDLTPYNFSGNSPIVFGDYDGKDFGIIYDHKNKKVYIVATYYVSKQEEAQATKALNDWNAKSAVASDGYTVVFSLKTKVPEMQTKEEFIKSDAAIARLRRSEQDKKYSA
ncbi:MAG: RHS repeat-associated core domain-containing protein, partial [Ferruginibacter sp.]